MIFLDKMKKFECKLLDRLEDNWLKLRDKDNQMEPMEKMALYHEIEYTASLLADLCEIMLEDDKTHYYADGQEYEPEELDEPQKPVRKGGLL